MAQTALIPAAAAALLTACATGEQVRQVEAQDYGPEPAHEVWHANLFDWFETRLKDPDSAQYRLGCPVRGYVKNAVLSGAGAGFEFVGYLARVEVNAKNSFGAYGGFKPYIATIARAGEVPHVYEALAAGGWDHPRIHVLDSKPCEVPTRIRVGRTQ